MLKHILLLFGIIWGSTAYVTKEASCPEGTGVKNFDISKFAEGTWYQTARYPNPFEGHGDCAYLKFDKNSTAMEFKVVGHIGDKLNVVQGFLYDNPEAVARGVVNLNSTKFAESEKRSLIDVNIVRVVYDKYVVGYYCNYDEETKLRREYAWIGTRQRKPDDETQAIIDDFLNTSDLIDSRELFWNRKDC